MKPSKAEAAVPTVKKTSMGSPTEMESEVYDEAPKGIDIPVPAGFEAPEDADKGGSFDVLATVSMKDGKLLLEAIDGLAVAAEESATEDTLAEDGEDADFMGAIERSLAEADDQAV